MKRYIAAVTQDLSSADVFSRISVASNPKTRPAILEKLASDPDADVRAEVAGNAATPEHILAALAKDKSYTVRILVAANTSTSSEILSSMLGDNDAAVFHKIANNPNSTSQILTELFDKTSQDNDMLEYDWELILKGILGNPNTPENVKDTIAEIGFNYNTYFEIIYSGDYDIAPDVYFILKDAGYAEFYSEYMDDYDGEYPGMTLYRAEVEFISNNKDESCIKESIRQALVRGGCTNIQIYSDDMYRED